MAVGKEDLKVSGKLSVGCSPFMYFSISLTVVVGISYSTICVFWISEVWSASQLFGRVWWSAWRKLVSSSRDGCCVGSVLSLCSTCFVRLCVSVSYVVAILS